MLARLSEEFGPNVSIYRLEGEIDDEKMDSLWNNIFAECKEDPDRTFILIITSDGGSFRAAFNFYAHACFYGDLKLVTVAVGAVASAGTMIFLAGKLRLAFKHALLMIHGVSFNIAEGLALNSKQLVDYARGLRRTNAALKRIIQEHITLSGDEVGRFIDRAEELSPSQAKKLGLVHRILK